MGELLEVEIPDRALFKASEVCELVRVQAYVLRSWEHEFPNLGIARTAGGPRVYRRADVEKVLRIKQLVFGEGLTLAGARRRIDGEPDDGEVPFTGDLFAPETRTKLDEVRKGLRSLLELLSGEPATVALPTGPDTPASMVRSAEPEDVSKVAATIGAVGWAGAAAGNVGRRQDGRHRSTMARAKKAGKKSAK